MSEALLGPDLSATIKALPAQIDSIFNTLSAGQEDLNDEIKGILWDRLTARINEMVTDASYEHDGFYYAWEVTGLYKIDNDVEISADINVCIKSEDFEFFEALLQDDGKIKILLEILENSIRDYLGIRGISRDAYFITCESDGFGYG